MAVEGLEELPALWGTPERYFRRSAQLCRADGVVLEFPAPEVTGPWVARTEDLEIGVPTAVVRLVKLARNHGWSVRVRYARGNRQHARTAQPLGLAHSLAVAMKHPSSTVRMVAVTFRPVRVSEWKWGTFLTSENGALTSIPGYSQFTEHLARIGSGAAVEGSGG